MFQPLEENDQETLKHLLRRYGSYRMLQQVFVINTSERKDYHEDAVIQNDTDVLGHALQLMVRSQPLLRFTDTIDELVDEADKLCEEA